jgi:hypothetical protein
MRKFIFTMFIVLATLHVAYAYDDHDFQVWNTDTEELKINKKAKVAFEQEFRWGNNARQLFYEHYDAGFFYNIKDWLNLGGGYRQIYDLVGDKFLPCDEPYLTLTLSGLFKGFKFDDRSRMEWNDFDYKDDFWRYRNKFTLRFPWKFTKFEIQPFVSEEGFLVFGGLTCKFNQNRFSAGLTANVFKNFKADIYYMLQSFKIGHVWKDANVLGTKFKLSF